MGTNDVEQVILTLALQSRMVKLDDQVYTIRELDGTARGKYLNGVSSRVIMGSGGRPIGMKDFTGLETALLKLCLYDPQGVLVPEAVMLAWPSSVLGSLFIIARDLSGLGEEAQKKLEQDAKND